MKNYDEVLPENEIMVVNEEKDESIAEKAIKALVPTATALALIIIIGTTWYVVRDNKPKEVTTRISGIDPSKEYTSTIAYTSNTDEEIVEEAATAQESSDEETLDNEEYTYEYKNEDVDYSNVTSFYNDIIENRNKYGNFAESFQSEEDIINLINFIYKFDGLYDYSNLQTTITSQQQFDEIISDYYKSCVKNNVDAELSILFKRDSLIRMKLEEAEDLANNLRNGNGKDYTISNNYYKWLAVNLIDERTKISYTTKNAPLIDLIREQYDEYRNVGNMLNARKYQKNDSLDIPKMDLYYDYTYPEDVTVTEVQNSFSCPDWGIDNIISKGEEIEETKLITKKDGTPFFAQVEMSFDEVLHGKVK